MNQEAKPSDDLQRPAKASKTTEALVEPERTLLQRIFRRKGVVQVALLPILAVFTALVIGGIIIAVSSPDVLAAWKGVSGDPLGAITTTFGTVFRAYSALFEGAFGSPARVVRGVGTDFLQCAQHVLVRTAQLSLPRIRRTIREPQIHETVSQLLRDLRTQYSLLNVTVTCRLLVAGQAAAM